VACATCHHDLTDVRGWVAGFPKVKPLPPPHTRVMTLLQANAEAVARHYRLPDALPAATAITAYLTALGADRPLSPGMSPGQPVFPARMRELDESVRRGASVFVARCGSCHRPAEVAPAVHTFPRVSHARAQSLETFLADHRASGRPLDWAGQEVADVVAHLVAGLAGGPGGARTEQARQEGP